MVFPLDYLLLFEPILFQASQGGHARVSDVAFTAAFLVVQIHSTLRAKSPAIAAANRLHGQCQQHLLGKDVGQKHALPIEKRDFGIVELEAFLFFLGHRGQRPVKEVEFARYILLDRFQAPGAHHLEARVEFPGNANLPFDQFGGRAHLERFRLPEIAGMVVDRSGRVALPDTNLAYCQVFDV